MTILEPFRQHFLHTVTRMVSTDLGMAALTAALLICYIAFKRLRD
jgi:hypothetical protein